MKFRHEYKHQISEFDYLCLKTKLAATLMPDKNGIDGSYKIRSLYFDDIFDSALKEKVDGVNYREKFRIRNYDNDTNFIRLEKKSKINGLCNKIGCPITASEVEQILKGDIDFLKEHPQELMRELYYKMTHKGLQPKTIVDYHRSAYTYPAGNVRITLDRDIATGLSCTDFLNPDCVTIPLGDNDIVLEVKWDEYIPDFVKTIVQMGGRRASAFSKYGRCRIFG